MPSVSPSKVKHSNNFFFHFTLMGVEFNYLMHMIVFQGRYLIFAHKPTNGL